MSDLSDLKDLPPDRWVFLERPRYCTNCSVEIEAGKKALFFPFTTSVYCYRCSRLLTGKLEKGSGRYKREYMPPCGR